MRKLNEKELESVYRAFEEATGKAIPELKKIHPPIWRHGHSIIKEKGRKKNLVQFNLFSREWEEQRRELNKEEISSFIEVSCRATECPMPLNLDTWDGLVCPFNCIYCFANYFRASLYTSFFDNAKNIGLRHVNLEKSKRILEKYNEYRGTRAEYSDPVANAFALEIPARFGIRFESFVPVDKKYHISLEIMKELRDLDYHYMINTKSTILKEPEYLKVLSESKAAVHITILTPHDNLAKILEPGAPSVTERLEMAKALNEVGVRVVGRIEPFMWFVNSKYDDITLLADKFLEAGITHTTWDTYSYFANSEGIKNAFLWAGIDYPRMFYASSESQPFGSILLTLAMRVFRLKGIQGSTFDFGNVPENDDDVCCSVGDFFDSWFNRYNILSATRYILHNPNTPVSYDDFVRWAKYPLSRDIKRDVDNMWNLDKDSPWTPDWVPGIEIYGYDGEGRPIYIYRPGKDYRLRVIDAFEELLGISAEDLAEREVIEWTRRN